MEAKKQSSGSKGDSGQTKSSQSVAKTGQKGASKQTGSTYAGQGPRKQVSGSTGG